MTSSPIGSSQASAYVKEAPAALVLGTIAVVMAIILGAMSQVAARATHHEAPAAPAATSQ